jgi:hypothetical protein
METRVTDWECFLLHSVSSSEECKAIAGALILSCDYSCIENEEAPTTIVRDTAFLTL